MRWNIIPAIKELHEKSRRETMGSRKKRLAKKYGCQVPFYIDSHQTIYAIPCGLDRTKTPGVVRKIAETDIVLTLASPYTDEKLEQFIWKAFDTCFEKEYQPGPTALEKYFNKKSWLQAVKGLRLIVIYGTIETGCEVVAMKRLPGRRGFSKLQTFKIDASPSKGVLAETFMQALALCR